MAYSANGLHLIASAGDAPSLWYYESADVVGDVDATDYFAAGADNGMKLGDTVRVYDTTTPLVTTCWVSAVDSDGNATVTQDA